jgi:Ca2+-binding EF-hand superfamily protein
MQYTLLLILIAAISSAVSGIAYTQTAPAESTGTAPPKYRAKFDAKFSAADRDADGALTKGEAQAAGWQRLVDHFDGIDTNKDGKVTRDEIRAFLRSRLSS